MIPLGCGNKQFRDDVVTGYLWPEFCFRLAATITNSLTSQHSECLQNLRTTHNGSLLAPETQKQVESREDSLLALKGREQVLQFQCGFRNSRHTCVTFKKR
jgi:hypothetical protein